VGDIALHAHPARRTIASVPAVWHLHEVDELEGAEDVMSDHVRGLVGDGQLARSHVRKASGIGPPTCLPSPSDFVVTSAAPARQAIHHVAVGREVRYGLRLVTVTTALLGRSWRDGAEALQVGLDPQRFPRDGHFLVPPTDQDGSRVPFVSRKTKTFLPARARMLGGDGHRDLPHPRVERVIPLCAGVGGRDPRLIRSKPESGQCRPLSVLVS
jgi:hypothetical protein